MSTIYRYLTRHACKSKWLWITSIYFTIMIVIVFRKSTVFKKILKVFGGEKPSWIVTAQTITQLEETVLRCTGEDMGCFAVLPECSARRGPLSRTECLKFCFESGNTYAGQTSEGNCYCDKTLELFVAKPLCDVSCSADRSKNCTAKNSIRIYRKTKDCQKGVQEALLDREHVGCMPVPKTLKGSTKAFKMERTTAQQCILQCESIKSQLAVPMVELGACLCSDVVSLFGSAENMLQTMRSCDGGKDLSFFTEQQPPIYQTYAEDSICGPKRFLRPKQGPFTILTSFWGSGNTWVRHLIESATGIYTGSIYTDDAIFRGGMIGEKVFYLSGRTIVIKDHIMSHPSKVSRRYTSAILLVRNPYDASLAEYTRLHTNHNHTGLINPKIFESAGFRKSVAALPGKWLYHAQMLFDIIPSVLVVYYEDVIRDPVKEMRRIVDFLPHELVKDHAEQLEKGLMCMNLDLTGSFRRPSKRLKSNPYDEKLREVYDTAIKRFDALMKEKNMQQMPASYSQKWDI